MQFLKNLFKVDPGAGFMERFVTLIVPVLVAALLLFLFGSCWQIFHNDIQRAAKLTGGAGAVIGTILFISAILWAWLNYSDKVPFRINETAATLIIALLIIFSVLFYTGFFAKTF